MNIANQISALGLTSNEDKITLGQVSGSLWSKETLTEGQLNHHVHIVGASGFGKTVLLLSHIVRDRIAKNKGLLFIDLKGDIDTIDKFMSNARQNNRENDVEIFSISDFNISNPYNLISEGTATQIRDKIMVSLNWSEEFYKNQAGSYLLKLLIGLCWLRDHKKLKVTLNTVLSCTQKPDFLTALSNMIPESEIKTKNMIEECYFFLESAENFKSLQGLRTQLESLILSDFGDLISSTEKGINLFEAIQNNKLVFMFLDSRRYGETAMSVGSVPLFC